ncbi:MAG: hypothetical protein R3195_14225 [Gemmatimonadota bacterium]|nr:hypothetical protein [Gemmatimonadota bacterium]
MVKTVLWMILFILVGFPFVYLLWDFINHALSGRFDLVSFGLAIVGGVGLFAVLKLVARRAAAWDEAP